LSVGTRKREPLMNDAKPGLVVENENNN